MSVINLTATVRDFRGHVTTKTAQLQVTPLATAGPLLGVFGKRTDNTPYLAPAGAPAFATHVYGGANNGSVNLSQPFDVNTAIVNMRPDKKPPSGNPIHRYVGTGSTCTLVLQSGQPCKLSKTDPVHLSRVEETLSGRRDFVWDSLGNSIAALGHPVVGTVWHEVEGQAEFMPGETTQQFSDVFLYVKNHLSGLPIVWYTCLIASQYKTGLGGDTYFTPALISAVDGLGADCYFDATSFDPATDSVFQAFFRYHPEKHHGLLETALWTDTADQGTCYTKLNAFYKANPNMRVLCGFFNNGGANNNGLLAPAGATVWDAMARDTFYSRIAA